MADSKVTRDPDETTAIVLAALDGTDRRRVAGVLLALASKLLAGSDEPQPVADMGEADLVPRYFRSTRVLRETLRSGELAGARAGRAIIVKRADLDAYLEAKRVRPRAPAPVAPLEDPAARSLARAGLRVVSR